jgi:hypothetical protein|tara:strand:- start:205 stop:357 length:153 start_codon:yes stop_codon:yes gene_type:complete
MSSKIHPEPTATTKKNELGFVHEAEHIAALLPPQLRDFSIIKEEQLFKPD